MLSADAIVSGQQAQALTAEPQFSTGGHQLIIADSAEHLLALPNSLLQSASTLELSGNQTVSASVLSQLATLGIKFNEAGYSLTCVDTAQNLASLSGVAAALAHAEVLSSSSVVTAVTAAALASLPNLSLATGVSLTVQDSAANLITLGQNIPSIATVETLPPGGTTTISAAQAVALAALPHFSAAGTTIVVADTVANLTEAGSTVLHVIANTVDVSDTAANLAADAADPIIQNAGSVTLSGNAVVTASVAAQIAAIPHFTAGTFQLEVADTAANIAAQAAAVANVATVTLVNDSGPISAAMANQLAMISASHGLSFQGGDQLLVQDSYAALTNPSNVAGVALASRLGVADTAANLVLASGHDWGALNPSFTLSQNGNVTASVATSLASLGSHFSTGGHLLTVADTAGAVIGAASAINTLHLTANVTDSAANLGAQASDLLNMGANLTNITVSDANPISATAAAGLSSLGNLLTGPEISVADDATNVDASIPGLEALSGHVAITITDNAAEVASYAAGLTALGNHLTIALTDSAPVTATLASALAPVAAQLAPIHLAVTDTGAAIAANAAILAGMGSSIGDVTLSDGNTQTVTTVAELAPLEDRLDAGVRLTAIGTAAEVAARESALTALNANDRLAAVLVLNTTVSDASTHIAALNALSAIVSVTDNAANVDAGLISLSQISHLQTITLTDSGTPTLSMTVATLASCAAILSSIASPYTITINDTAAHIAADLSSGAASDILGHVQQLNQIASSDGQPIVLNQAQILAHNVDDGPGAALSLFTGAVQVTGVDVAHLGQVTALPHAPASVAVTDTSLNIGTDLAQGNSSSILQNIGRVAQITASPDEPVSLTAAQALHPGVDDGPSSAFGIMLNATLDISNSAIANLTQLANLYITPAAIAVTDTGANISADLGSTTSSLVASLPTITTILVGDGATISLDEQQVLTSGVDDGADSVMAKVIGAALNVTQVASGDIATILGLYGAPTSISVTDTAAHVVSNLQDVLTDIGAISAIDISSGTLTLSAGEALESRVDDGLNSLIARVDGHSFYVTGSTVSELAALTSLSFAPTLISVDDSSSNIASDLQSGQSLLAAHITSLGAITVTHGTLNLASATATSILSNSFLDAVLSHLVPETVVSVMNVPVSGLSALAASDWPNLTVSVADTVSNIASDLASGSSVLQENSVFETSVVLTGGGVVGAATLAEMAALPNLQTAGNSLTVCDTAAAILALSPSTIQIAHSVQIVDTASDIATSLDLLQNEFGGALLITATGANPAITVTAAQYLADQPTIDAVSNPGVFIVAGSALSLAAIAGVLDADAAVYTVSVSDSAFNVISNLQNLASAGQKLQVHLSDTSIPANLVAPLLSIPNLAPAGLPVTDSGSQIAALVESGNPGAVSYLNTYGASLSVTSYVSAADAVALEGLTMFSKAGHTLAIWDTAQHLTTPAYAAALSSSAVDGVYLKTNGGTVTLTATQAAELFSIPGFSTSNPSGTPNTLVVSDTAAHIESELAPLTANAGQVSSILVNSTATVSDQVLSDLQGLHATAGAGVSLSVRDTAANIAASSAAQVSGQSIQPASWSLSANGTVTEADALKLAGLAHFTPGPFDLNIALIADTLISVADANTLGTLAGAVSLGSYQLQVAGSAAQLSALSSQALQVVTPRLIDSAADLAAISTNSPLLQGSVEVSGNDMLTAATTAALLNQIHSAGGGNGIAVATLTFDAAHTVVDTVANLRALTLSAGWLNNPSIHADFNLIAQDNAANLVNPSNTAFLSGLTSTTLSGNTTINAGTADALASVSPTIHFDRGSSSITVQDTAANLISINNASGVALANIVELGGPDHVDAADAETLLGISHLVLNTSLMITDSSTNLLDGALENAILSTASGPHVIVQLAGPETLDAQTAESLVSIPGFADAHNMTISDDPSYLLNAANLSAEQMALQVTLASNETVSANMVLRLSEVPHFAPGGFQLELGGNDFADAATLKAIADMGDAFNANGHTVTMTTDVLNLTPQEFANLQSDQISLNGHLLGVLPSDVTVSDTASVMHVAGTGVSGGTVDVYSASGSLLSTTAHAGASFTISANDIGQGQNFSLTETVNGNTSQGAPIVLLDAGAIETSVAAAGGNFAASGGLQVDTGKFISLYQAGSVPSLSYAALVYDPVAHTVALDIPGQGSTVLITLGGTTHPMALDASEILFKLHG